MVQPKIPVADADLAGVIWRTISREHERAFPVLDGDREADLAVVGGGYLGLTTALTAAEAGLSVAVLETGRVGNGASGRNGGFVVPQYPGPLSVSAVCGKIGRTHGERLSALVTEGPTALFDFIRTHQIACDGEQNGWIQPAHSEKALARVRKVYEDWKALGAPVTWLEGEETRRLTGSPVYRGGWMRENGGTVNPYALAVGLARVAANAGAEIFERSAVTGIATDGVGATVRTAGGTVRARNVFVATNGYTPRLIARIERSVIPIELFMVVTTPLSEADRERVLPTRMCFTDVRKSGGFGRLDRDGRLMSGGLTFRLADDRSHRERHARRRIRRFFPQLGETGFDAVWAGYCTITEDFLPKLQRLDRNVFALMGFGTRGVAITHQLGRDMGRFFAGERAADDLALPMHEGAAEIPLQPLKWLAGRYAYPAYKALDRLGLS